MCCLQKHMDYATFTMNQWAEIVHFMHIRLSTVSFLKLLDKMGALCHLSGIKILLTKTSYFHYSEQKTIIFKVA